LRYTCSIPKVLTKLAKLKNPGLIPLKAEDPEFLRAPWCNPWCP
jgi:hypothetical protein